MLAFSPASPAYHLDRCSKFLGKYPSSGRDFEAARLPESERFKLPGAGTLGLSFIMLPSQFTCARCPPCFADPRDKGGNTRG